MNRKHKLALLTIGLSLTLAAEVVSLANPSACTFVLSKFHTPHHHSAKTLTAWKEYNQAHPGFKPKTRAESLIGFNWACPKPVVTDEFNLDSDLAQLEPILPPDFLSEQSPDDLEWIGTVENGELIPAPQGGQYDYGLITGGYGSGGNPGFTLPPTVPSIPQPVPEASSILLMMFGFVLFLIAFRKQLVYRK